MATCFFTNLCYMQPEVGGILEGLFVPRVSSESLFAMAGLIGCIIMPHNLYLHSSIVQSREIDRNDVWEVASSIQYFNLESFVSLLVSLFINICVLSTFAKFQSTYQLTRPNHPPKRRGRTRNRVRPHWQVHLGTRTSGRRLVQHSHRNYGWTVHHGGIHQNQNSESNAY